MTILLVLSQLSLADSLYTNGYYDLAEIEYQRQFFFEPNLYQNKENRLHYAISLFKNKQYKGITEFEKLIEDFPDLSPESKILMAKQYISIGDYYHASELLSPTPDKKLLGLAYFLDERFIAARNLFITSGEYELAEEVNSYLTRPKKSATKAAVLSFICPGSGEIYAGNIKLGITDFLLNFGTGYLLYDAFKDKRYVDASLIFSFLFHRFYLGSIANAQRLVQERNEKDKQRWLSSIRKQYFE